MKIWKFAGYDKHVFTYDTNTGWLSCSCGNYGDKVSSRGAEPESERHVRKFTRSMGSLVTVKISP